MSDPDPAKLDLSSLRAELDRVDAAIAALIGQRLALARRVGERKAASGAAIFDRDRENDLLRARRAAARERSLDPDVVENVFRQIILASHREQRRTLRARSTVEPLTVAVVGGKGRMGGFFANFFREIGHSVLVADLDTELTPQQAAAQADVVVVSVPIASTLEVIEQVGPHVRAQSLLMDLTSLKEAPVQAMLEHSDAEVVGAHPLFGPGVESLARQVVALCPARGTRWAGWLRRTLEAEGAEVVETTPVAHDRMMAIIQVLRHFGTIALGATLADLGVNVQETLRFSSPIYRLELVMVGRLFSQSPELYADIEMENPRRNDVIDAFAQRVDRLAQQVRAGDREAFMREFRRVSAYFGDFKDQAMEESAYLIARMVERM